MVVVGQYIHITRKSRGPQATRKSPDTHYIASNPVGA